MALYQLNNLSIQRSDHYFAHQLTFQGWVAEEQWNILKAYAREAIEGHFKGEAGLKLADITQWKVLDLWLDELKKTIRLDVAVDRIAIDSMDGLKGFQPFQVVGNNHIWCQAPAQWKELLKQVEAINAGFRELKKNPTKGSSLDPRVESQNLRVEAFRHQWKESSSQPPVRLEGQEARDWSRLVTKMKGYYAGNAWIKECIGNALQWSIYGGFVASQFKVKPPLGRALSCEVPPNEGFSWLGKEYQEPFNGTALHVISDLDSWSAQEKQAAKVMTLWAEHDFLRGLCNAVLTQQAKKEYLVSKKLATYGEIGSLNCPGKKELMAGTNQWSKYERAWEQEERPSAQGGWILWNESKKGFLRKNQYSTVNLNEATLFGNRSEAIAYAKTVHGSGSVTLPLSLVKVNVCLESVDVEYGYSEAPTLKEWGSAIEMKVLQELLNQQKETLEEKKQRLMQELERVEMELAQKPAEEGVTPKLKRL